MTDDPARPDWPWEDPQRLSATVDGFTVDLARCDSIELVTAEPAGASDNGAPARFTRDDLNGLGITGIEFAAFTTTHPTGLGSDLVGLHSADGTTKPGNVYRIDGSAYFIQLDIAEPLPFADNTVDWVYAEHLIEHVSLSVATAWLTEVRRILAPGGLLRLSTPDLSVYAHSYVDGDRFFAKHRRRMDMALAAVAPPMPARSAFMFNQLFYVYGHRWIYDEAELRHVLGTAGFDPSAVTVCAYRQGARSDIANLDQVLRNDESIYVEVTA